MLFALLVVLFQLYVQTPLNESKNYEVVQSNLLSTDNESVLSFEMHSVKSNVVSVTLSVSTSACKCRPIILLANTFDFTPIM